MNELAEKENRVKALMAQAGVEALLLERVSSFAWYTGGAACFVNTTTDKGVASLLITPQAKYLITNNIEAPRLKAEEELADHGYEFVVGNWWEASQAVARLTEGLRLGADGLYPGALDLSAEIAHLRARLLPQEVERFRDLGARCGQAIEAAARALWPGMTEYEIAALLARESFARGFTPIVNLIASDERVFRYRHPIPTDRVLERYAMLVLCGRRWGLVASATRLVHFGPLPDELRRKGEAVARVDAAFIAATRPGARVANVFGRAVETYAAVGFPDEWQLHHQGGAAGYEPREYVATPASTEVVEAGQAFAWNPSITGAKSEDTIIVGAEGNEIITATGEWPTIDVEIEGQVLQRPAILEVT